MSAKRPPPNFASRTVNDRKSISGTLYLPIGTARAKLCRRAFRKGSRFCKNLGYHREIRELWAGFRLVLRLFEQNLSHLGKCIGVIKRIQNRFRNRRPGNSARCTTVQLEDGTEEERFGLTSFFAVLQSVTWPYLGQRHSQCGDTIINIIPIMRLSQLLRECVR